MAITFQKALGLYENALSLRADRASVLSSNLANADTPNYKAKDINFHQALRAQMGESSTQLNMSQTSRGHVNKSGGTSFSADRLFRIPFQPAIDGNTVDEQIEHAEFMKNSLEFQAAFTMLNSRFKGLRKAIKGE